MGHNKHLYSPLSVELPSETKMKSVLFAMAGAFAAATELTPDNWDSMTAGKTTFIKFQAPW